MIGKSTSLGGLRAFCDAAHESGGFTAQARVEARSMVREALEADQAAISKVEECLDVLAGSD